MTQQQRDRLFLAGLFLGATVGAAVASLLAHGSSPEAAETPSERGIELTGRADEAVQRAQQIAGAAVAKVQGALPDGLRQPGAAEGS